MIKTLGKAFYWQRLLEDGKYATARDLARAFNLEPGWVAVLLIQPLFSRLTRVDGASLF